MDPTVRLDQTTARPATHATTSGVARIDLTMGRGVEHAAARSSSQVLVRVAAGDATNAARLPVNLAIAIDRSGSMDGEPLAQARAACVAAIDLLGPEDVLSIVTFEEQVDVVMPARHVTDKDRIRAHVERIVAGNTTNLFDGLYAAGSQAASVPGDGYVHRLLLLTDGEPTAGIKDSVAIAQLAADLRAKGIVVSALGFGPDYNEELLAAIAARSGGNYRFLARADAFADVFRDEVLAARRTVARDVRLRLELPRDVAVRSIQGKAPDAAGPRFAEVVLPDLESGASLAVLCELECAPRGSGEYRIARAVLTSSHTGTIATADAVVRFVDDAGAARGGVHPDVAREAELLRAGADIERTRAAMRTSTFSATNLAATLERTQALLVETGRAEAAADVAEATRALRRGDTTTVEKTLMGTLHDLGRGWEH